MKIEKKSLIDVSSKLKHHKMHLLIYALSNSHKTSKVKPWANMQQIK